MGFRPNRNCHKVLKLLNTMIENNNTNYILDADIKGFFDNLDHEWIIKFVESRIKDANITRLMRRMLRAGIMKDYNYEVEESGSGQGSVWIVYRDDHVFLTSDIAPVIKGHFKTY